MNHYDRINLLKDGVSPESRVWAEFGSGSGAFTLALAELIHPNGVIYSLDKNLSALRQQEKIMHEQFPHIEVHYLAADFTKALDLLSLDGILMANALHFIKEKVGFVSQIKNYLKPEGQLLIVEYNIDRGNPWVPYPISFKSWQALAGECGFANVRLLKTAPSRYHREVYSAASNLGMNG